MGIGFQFVGTAVQGYVSSLTDLSFASVGGQIVVIGATHVGGGTSIWGVTDANGLAEHLASYAYSDNQRHLAEPQAIVLDRPYGEGFLIAGLLGGGDAARALDSGGLRGAADTPFIAAAVPVDLLHAGSFSTFAGAQLMWTARHDQPTFQLWRQWSDGRISAVATTTAPPGLVPDAQIDAIVAVRLGGVDLLVSASTRGNFISAHLVGPAGGLASGEFVGSARGTGFNGPRDIVAVEVEGKHYLVVSSAYSSSLTTVRILPGGGMVPVDHIIDERTTRFQSATVMESVTIDGRSFVVVGGADDGLSLFTVTPDGRLIHLDSIADDQRAALADVSALALRVIDGRIVALAASATESGLSQFVLDPGKIGQTRHVAEGAHVGSDENDLIQGGLNTTRISGGAGDDILIAGSRAIALVGGAGADVFVPLPVGGRVAILDYTPGEDRLDLSMLGMVRSTYQLRIVSNSQGAKIHFMGGFIDVISRNRTPLSAADFDNSMFPVAHYQPPDVRSTILGTAGFDVLRAAAGGSTIYGYGGNDTLFGSGLEDHLLGGAGHDRLISHDGDDTIWGMGGNDFIRAGAMNDVVLAGEDHDVVLGEAGDDRIAGQTGNDIVYGGTGDDRVNGGSGHDYLAGEAGNDRLYGLSGDDRMVGGAGDDIMVDAVGDNVFRDVSGNNMMFGGPGRDRMYGGTGRDTMRSGDGNDFCAGGGDRDNISSGAGDDTVLGGDGDDLVIGVGGNDWLYGGAGNDAIWGGDDDDRLAGNDGNDVMMGGRGRDVLIGAEGDDTLRGHSENDKLYAGAGNDRLIGGTGDDTLAGDVGDDLHFGEAGRDILIGGAGNDTLDGGWGEDSIWGNTGNDLLLGGQGADMLRGGAGADTLAGGDHDDHLAGQGDNDLITGGAGDDVLVGDWGDDTLQGDDGADLILGGIGADHLSGGGGADTLEGGDDADFFIFAAFEDAAPAAPDVIADFVSGQDRIDLSALGIISVAEGGLTRTAGEAVWTRSDDTVVVLIDGDGDGQADMEIRLLGIGALARSDFIL